MLSGCNNRIYFARARLLIQTLNIKQSYSIITILSQTAIRGRGSRQSGQVLGSNAINCFLVFLNKIETNLRMALVKERKWALKSLVI